MTTESAGDGLDKRGSRWIFMVMGHLKPGVTPAQATADLNSTGSYLEKTYPKDEREDDFYPGSSEPLWRLYLAGRCGNS